MIDYDFSTLNDKEFENLSIELISKDRNKRFERFKAGKDGGIDGRYYHENDTQEIVQCKHYLKTGFDGLLRSLKKKNDKGINEIDKVNSLDPSKYIFITSLPLSAENKKTIKKLFDPYINNDNDIYGQEDLNQILAEYTDIEKRYYKLWLSSTVVLDRIFNNAIESRSEFLLEDIKENAKYYVITENHNKAIEKLESSHIIIIAGEPGIGKTTLAEHIALWYVEKDFKFYNIENSINEAENVYKRDEKQIFYFDDFLGANYLNAIEDKKDSHIVKFMERIKKDKTKRFILTSRTNIFNQGLALSDTFKSKNIESEEFLIQIESLKDIDKAMILYNHIWHSSLDEKFIDEIYFDQRYYKIIYHKNFNPRLIAFITDNQKLQKENVKEIDYWGYIVEKLDNPQDIWKNTFDKQCDEFTRIIVSLVVFNGNRISEKELQNAYMKYIKLVVVHYSSHMSKDFDSIEEVVKYFLNRYKRRIGLKTSNRYPFDKKKDIIEYTLFNPSIADFVINKYINNSQTVFKSFISLRTVSSLENLESLFKNKKLSRDIYKSIMQYLYNDMDISITKGVDYNIQLTYMIIVNSPLLKFDTKKIYLFYQDCIDSPRVFSYLDKFITTICRLKKKSFNIKSYDFIHQIMDNVLHFANEFNSINKLIELVDYFKINDKYINRDISEFIESTLISELYFELDDLTSDSFDMEIDYNGEVYSITNQLEEYAKRSYDELIEKISLIDGIDVNQSYVLDNLEIYHHEDRIITEYYESSMNEENNINNTFKYNQNNIADLFER